MVLAMGGGGPLPAAASWPYDLTTYGALPANVSAIAWPTGNTALTEENPSTGWTDVTVTNRADLETELTTAGQRHITVAANITDTSGLGVGWTGGSGDDKWLTVNSGVVLDLNNGLGEPSEITVGADRIRIDGPGTYRVKWNFTNANDVLVYNCKWDCDTTGGQHQNDQNNYNRMAFVGVSTEQDGGFVWALIHISGTDVAEPNRQSSDLIIANCMIRAVTGGEAPCRLQMTERVVIMDSYFENLNGTGFRIGNCTDGYIKHCILVGSFHQANYQMTYNSGGPYVVQNNDTITGRTSLESVQLGFVNEELGSWATEDSEGLFQTNNAPGGPFTPGEILDVGANLDVANVVTDFNQNGTIDFLVEDCTVFDSSDQNFVNLATASTGMTIQNNLYKLNGTGSDQAPLGDATGSNNPIDDSWDGTYNGANGIDTFTDRNSNLIDRESYALGTI